MNKKLIIATIAFGIIAGIALYMMPAAANEPCSYNTDEDVGRVMEIAGMYITKEAVANQKIEDLILINRELELEIKTLKEKR